MAHRQKPRDFVVIGLQGFGENLTLALQDLGQGVLGIDRSRALVQRLADNLKDVAALDPTDPDALAAAGVDAFETAVIALGDDLAQTVLVTLALKDLKVNRILAEAKTDRDRIVLLKLGVSQVVAPELESARAVASQLCGLQQFRTYAEMEGARIVSWTYPETNAAAALADVQETSLPGVIVLLVIGAHLVPNPPPDTIVQPGDSLVLFGQSEVFANLAGIGT